MADDQEQYVTFDTTKGGEYSLCLFIEIVPETWHATFYELYHHGYLVTQYVHTERPINRFVATPLVKGLPGAVDWEWNGAQMASSNTRRSRNQAKERWRMLMQERDEAIAELQTLTKKASEIHEEIEALLGTHRTSQGGE